MPAPMPAPRIRRGHEAVGLECVVFLTRSIASDCHFARLAALLATSGNRTVWLLHNEPPDAASLGMLSARYPQLMLAQQPEITSAAWRTFGGKMIGYSKAAFLLWLLRNGSGCSRTWQIEDDVFFSGRWDELFDGHAHMSADLLAPTGPLSEEGEYCSYVTCTSSFDQSTAGSSGSGSGSGPGSGISSHPVGASGGISSGGMARSSKGVGRIPGLPLLNGQPNSSATPSGTAISARDRACCLSLEASRARNCYLSSSLACKYGGPAHHTSRVTIWPVLRLSRRLAAELGSILNERGGHGFHEFLIAPACTHARWCASTGGSHGRCASELPPGWTWWNCTRGAPRADLLGKLESGHMAGVSKAEQTLERLAAPLAGLLPGEALVIDSAAPGATPGSTAATAQPPLDGAVQKVSLRLPYSGKVFHPVKCEADGRLGIKAQRWARLYPLVLRAGSRQSNGSSGAARLLTSPLNSSQACPTWCDGTDCGPAKNLTCCVNAASKCFTCSTCQAASVAARIPARFRLIPALQ